MKKERYLESTCMFVEIKIVQPAKKGRNQRHKKMLVAKCDECHTIFDTSASKKDKDCHFCSINCQNQSQKTGMLAQKKIDTFIEHFGVDNPWKSKEIINKIEDTKEQKYGDRKYNNAKQMKETRIERYGFYLDTEKIKQTNLQRYGVECVFQIPDVVQKIKSTNLERYGYEHNFQAPDYYINLRQTMRDRYGVDCAFDLPHVREAAKLGQIKLHQEKKSKLEIEFFNLIKEQFVQAKQDIIVMSNDKMLFPDILIDNVIIEFYGNYWHMNPKLYESNYFNKKIQSTAKQIWNCDRKRSFLLRKFGFIVLVIWEDEYKNNKNKAIKYICEKVNKHRIDDFIPRNAILHEVSVFNEQFKLKAEQDNKKNE